MEDYKIKQRAIFLTYIYKEEGNGIYKKVIAQNNALIKNGISTDCFFLEKGNDNKTYFILNNSLFSNFENKNDISFFYKKLWEHIVNNSIKLVFIRYAFNAGPRFNSFLKQCKRIGCKVILEIPTYPYDNELKITNIKEALYIYVEKIWRKRLFKYVYKIITYSTDKYIFNIPTINISNGVDKSTITVKENIGIDDNCIRLIGVANINFWHGYDRLIRGLYTYYKTEQKYIIYFHIVGLGNISVYNELKSLINDLQLNNYVFLEGSKEGKELNEIFSKSHMAVGCLGCHRKNIKEVKSLKNVEYAMRGIPMLYSENNYDFDNQKYVLKFPANESEINVNKICDFIKNNKFNPIEIRETVNHLTWDHQMQIVLENIDYKE